MFLQDYNKIILLVAIVTLALVAVALFMKLVKYILRIRQKRQKRRAMLEMINSAKGEGSPFYIQMGDQDDIMGDMQWNCESVTAQGILLHLPGQDVDIFQADQNIVIYFKVFYKGQDRYYNFQSRVLGLSHAKTATTLLASLPGELGTSQKRKYLRVKPSQGSVRDLTVWKYTYALTQDSLDESTGRPTPRSKDLLLDESVTPGSGPEWTPMPASRVNLYDISEGGICLRVQGKRNALIAQERVIIHLELDNPNQGGAAELYFFGEVLRFSMVPARVGETGPVFKLGIRFLRWGQRRDNGYLWRPVTERANVAPLVAWIRRQHQFQHRLIDD